MARLLGAVSLALVVAMLATSTAHAQESPGAPPTSRAVESPPQGPILLWPPTPPADTIDHPRLLRGHDMGLISAGIVGLSLGMMVGIILASLDLTRGNCETFSGFRFTSTRVQCGTAPFALIPFAGSIVVGTVGINGSVSDGGTVVSGIVAAAPQIAGLVLLLLGMHGYTEDLVGDVHVQLDPVVSGSQLGAILTVRL